MSAQEEFIAWVNTHVNTNYCDFHDVPTTDSYMHTVYLDEVGFTFDENGEVVSFGCYNNEEIQEHLDEVED